MKISPFGDRLSDLMEPKVARGESPKSPRGFTENDGKQSHHCFHPLVPQPTYFFLFRTEFYLKTFDSRWILHAVGS